LRRLNKRRIRSDKRQRNKPCKFDILIGKWNVGTLIKTGTIVKISQTLILFSKTQQPCDERNAK